ncbi:hypothetical protein AB0D04_29425 [Streptomyces sp. NPDC048483]|uniref:hypothetical protein n=1 Tax=Streptomyces sp. NPDC048483 TaxID=3154927 RepID=UPI00341BDE0D
MRATQELIDGRVGRREAMAVEVILRHGSRADAEALFPVFLSSPEAHEQLVPVFARHGDRSLAERLLDAGFKDGRLRRGMPANVLHALGCLGHEPAERLLWDHIDTPLHDADACLGLLHLPCRSLRTEIAQALERHAGAAWFPEFLPALAAKTGDPSWLGRLVSWGAVASTDCNGGLILGIALYGDAARTDYRRMLWNPDWEAYGGGTGANLWAYAGALVLGLGMVDLYADLVTRLRSDADPAVKRHCVRTFAALLRLWAGRRWCGLRMAPEPTETCEALHHLVFEWSTPHTDDSLIGLIGDLFGPGHPRQAELYELERELEIRARHEWEIGELKSRSTADHW